jgi:hypothetical protein
MNEDIAGKLRLNDDSKLRLNEDIAGTPKLHLWEHRGECHSSISRCEENE